MEVRGLEWQSLQSASCNQQHQIHPTGCRWTERVRHQVNLALSNTELVLLKQTGQRSLWAQWIDGGETLRPTMFRCWENFCCGPRLLTCVMVSVSGPTTALHTIHSCSLFRRDSALRLMAPSTASPKASGEVGPETPQATRVWRHGRNLQQAAAAVSFDR